MSTVRWAQAPVSESSFPEERNPAKKTVYVDWNKNQSN